MENYHVSNLSMHCVSQSNGKYATANEWCRVISHNPIMPALINHFFGSDSKGLFGATPFEVVDQVLEIFKFAHFGITLQLSDYP